MTPLRWARIKEIFCAAREQPEQGRAVWLEEACGGDDELRAEVERLLAQDEESLPSPAPRLLAHAAPALAGGEVLSHYRVEAKIGEGGMGAVYRAYDTQLRRQVALKVLPPAHFAAPESRRRLIREARAAAALNHPNIVDIHEVGSENGLDFIAMELVAGDTLGKVIPAKGLPLSKALDYGVQIAPGLVKAHALGVVHRDLKPANVMVTPDGLVKLLDFGLAQRTDVDQGESTQTVEAGIAGTPAYMSPEQAHGKAPDTRSDVFSFGVVLYQMLAGRQPFTGDSTAAILAAVLREDPASLEARVPRDLEKIVARCLRKDPAQRFQHMDDVKVELEELKSEFDSGKSHSLIPVSHTRLRWPFVTAISAGATLLAVLGSFGLYRWITRHTSEPFARIEVVKLTDTGRASVPVISPDGKWVAHADSDRGQSSLWIRHVATGDSTRILSPIRGSFTTLEFSHDGNSLYYVFNPGKPPAALYRISVLGGNAVRLTEFARTVFPLYGLLNPRISPDEKQIAFIRRTDVENLLMIASLDGSSERQIASYKGGGGFRAVDWSPDGKILAYTLVPLRGGLTGRVATRSVQGGPERILSAALRTVEGVHWLPDGQGLLVTAERGQIWYVPYRGRQSRRITNDLTPYSSLSLAEDSSKLVALQTERNFRIWVVSIDGGTAPRIITDRVRGEYPFASWIGNGQIAYGAQGNRRQPGLWIVTADGSSRRALSPEGASEQQPDSCGNGRKLVFTSTRTGDAHIWTSNTDGANPRQLTFGGGEFFAACSPDASWFTYGSMDPKHYGVFRMPIEGGASIQLWRQYGSTDIAPDGKSVLVREWWGNEDKVRIIPSGGGEALATFDLPSEIGTMRWSADSKSLLFVKTRDGVSNLWRQPLIGGAPKQVTNFESEQISGFSFAESPDGTKLVVARGTPVSDVVLIRDLK